MGTASEKYSKVYLETIMRADGQPRLRARWINPANGKQQNRILGLASDFPGWNKKTKPAKLQTELDRLQLQVNTKPVNLIGYTVGDLIKEYLEQELLPRAEGEDKGYAVSYINRTKPAIAKHIEPRWGKVLLSEIGTRAYEIEKWLDKLKGDDGKPLARGTKAKIKFTFQAILNYAIRRNRFEGMNPLKTFTQSAKRSYVPELLTPEQFEKLLAKLGFRERLLIFLAMTTGLRRSEIAGLQWQDLDFLGLQVNVNRGVVDGVEGDCKSEASTASVPLSAEVAEMLKSWRSFTSHNPTDFVFVAESNRAGKHRGKKPLVLSRIFQYWVQPVAKELGIEIHNFGYHTFRRTYISWLAAVEPNPKVVMELARHAKIATTMEVYASLKKDKGLREAHSKGLGRLNETLKQYSHPSLCVATHNFSEGGKTLSC